MTPDYTKIAAVLRVQAGTARPGYRHETSRCDACPKKCSDESPLCPDCLNACADACEVVAKLPRTANGVIFSGAMVVYVHPDALAERCWLIYKRDNPDRAYRGTFTIPKAANVMHCPAPIDGGNYVTLAICPENDGEPNTLYVRMEFVYSTSEAADLASLRSRLETAEKRSLACQLGDLSDAISQRDAAREDAKRMREALTTIVNNEPVQDGGGGVGYQHYDIDGNDAGWENVDPLSVIGSMVTTAREALAPASKPAPTFADGVAAARAAVESTPVSAASHVYVINACLQNIDAIKEPTDG